MKNAKREKEEHYIVIKEPVQKEAITIINIYVSNIGANNYIKQL